MQTDSLSSTLIEMLRDVDADAVIAVVAIVGGVTVALVSVVGGIVTGIRSRREREETKRELAAYVAEGSLTLDQAERLIRADLGDDSISRKAQRRLRREAREQQTSIT